MATEIRIEHRKDSFGKPLTILRTEPFNHFNSVYIGPTVDEVEINLSDWYGRRSFDEAEQGIDAIIALLQATKAEIAKLRQPEPAPESSEI